MTIPIQRKDGTPIEWEQAKGFSKYLVSDTGLVYSLENDILIPLNENTCGYMRAYILNDEGQRKQSLVHRLVYMAHVGDIPKGMQINHKDECKTNNCIENLEVVTCKQNINYGTANKRRAKALKRYYRERRQAVASC
ncbi:HNH endonuclease signature motif containing protein [Bacteroides acidifaciens]|uniref:HNH endonuclease signature motif containing protein n=1 Tax=Bacteroides acidifaciens TaxID=85831 RepID=UPI0025D5CA8C|nr:HNH endonuclease signature motif containing protein [Bacteroides acidifaciens]